MSDGSIVTQADAAYTDEQRKLITDVLCKGATDQEVAFFMQVAQRCRLDPFKRQIHAIKRWDSTLKREAMTFQVGIDGLRAIADRTGAYAGNDDAVFEIDSRNGAPIKATCTVYKLVGGQRVAFTGSAIYSECVQTKKDGEPNSMWAKRPFGQLAKCAEAMALRKAFPEDTGGLYTPEEIDHDDPPQAEPAPKSSPISSYPGKQKAPDGDVVDAEVVDAQHWSELLPDAWRDIRIQAGPFKGQAVGKLDKEARAWAGEHLTGATIDGMALAAMRWIHIERMLASMNLGASDFEEILVQQRILEEGQRIFDLGGDRLPELFNAARDLQKTQPQLLA